MDINKRIRLPPQKYEMSKSIKVQLWLKGAPIPVARNTAGNGEFRLAMRNLCRVVGLFFMFDVGMDMAGIQLLLNSSHASSPTVFPSLIRLVALIASPRSGAFRMEARILVERNHVGSMAGAKDVAAVTTVMAASEDAERGATRG